jgi:hypothetical protein
MLQYIIKVVLSATLIVVVSEASKKSSLVGGIFASVPLISVLALIWLYIETRLHLTSAYLPSHLSPFHLEFAAYFFQSLTHGFWIVWVLRNKVGMLFAVPESMH